jgi:signal transduction histidine kinase
MIRRLADWKLKGKLVALALLTSGATLVAASAVLLVSNVLNTHATVRRELATIAEILGNNSAAAMVFNDDQAARETLAAISAKPNIVGAFLFRADGSLFAHQTAPGAPAAWQGDDRAFAEAISRRPSKQWESLSNILRDGLLGVRRAVTLGQDKEEIGAIFVIADFRDVIRAAALHLLITLLAIGGSIPLAWWVAHRLQGMVSRPIYRLGETMRLVAREENYAVRAPKHGDDELGELIDGFNRMLAQVQARDEHLQAARRDAELGNRAKSEFLAAMSHELRTPLNAIIGFSEIMSNEMFGPLGAPNYREYAADIHASGTHLLDIINDILDVARVEAGKLTLRETEIDVRALIEKSVRLVRERAATAGLQLAVDIADDLPLLRADERLIKQSITNLLSNAIKFTPKGGAIVLTAGPDAGGGMTIAVRDSGIGIDAANLEKVFSPFYQVDSTLARTQEGLGLGLPLVKSFIEQHGGAVSIASKPGRGTTVRLHFPADRCRANRVARAENLTI